MYLYDLQLAGSQHTCQVLKRATLQALEWHLVQAISLWAWCLEFMICRPKRSFSPRWAQACPPRCPGTRAGF